MPGVFNIKINDGIINKMLNRSNVIAKKIINELQNPEILKN